MSSPNPGALPPGSKVKLSVVRGVRAGKTYGLKEGINYLGRAGTYAVDVDLAEQEKQVFITNRHAAIFLQNGVLTIADTGSPIGTYLNRVKLQKGQRPGLKAEDVINLGNVALQVKVILKKKTGVQK